MDQGVAVGQLGGSRDQLARGQAAGEFGQGMQNLVGQLYGQQYNADTMARSQALGQTGAMQAAQYSPLFAAQQLIGGPTVLGRSASAGQNTGFNTSAGGNQSTGSSFGNSSSMGMGVGAK